MPVCPAALGLPAERVEAVLRAAGAAPSLHNSQPWSFRLWRHLIEVHADVGRRLPAADPEDRELRLGCGAALLNLRLALDHHRVHPVVTVPPDGDDRTTLLAEVRAGQRGSPSAESERLYGMIERRHTARAPFRERPVPAELRHEMIQAVQREGCWLHVVGRGELGHLEGLVHRAHRVQMADGRFREELARWTGRDVGDPEGVPAAAAGPAPEPQDQWVLRDFSAGRAPRREPGLAFEAQPLLAVVSSQDSGPRAEVRAGEALQRMLLTATAGGLVASLMSQVIEVAETRQELATLLGGGWNPHAVVRIGFGAPGPPAPRRPVGDVVEAGTSASSP
ncbi:Acg family FMN-binding oxidoreductase [Saccharopolyspora sp. MS10]|uniref:Acg family FMN-binding oxidoreductase n=1 Tax=Saccharopolyspora sp. MS10 TaxID=3385973 RepID=UPI0039A09668